jgi:hypothetical protein
MKRPDRRAYYRQYNATRRIAGKRPTEYFRDYRARNRAKVNEYNRLWMRRYRRALRKKAKVKA